MKERDIEQFLSEHHEVLDFLGFGGVQAWVGRQVRVPSGRIDLLGLTDEDVILVIELKNTRITSACLTQVCRYANDIQIALYKAGRFNPIQKLILGPGNISSQIMYEAEALGILICSIEISEDLVKVCQPWRWSEKEEKITKLIRAQLGEMLKEKIADAEYWLKITPKDPI